MLMHGRLLIILVGLAVGPAQGLEAKKGEWLLRQDPAAYTLQVITVSSAEQVAKLLEQHGAPERFASFRIQGKEQLLFVLTYGVFEGTEQAEQARAQVAAALALQSDQLWVRRLSAVQQAIRTTLQL